MNKIWIEQKERNDRAFGKFISVHKFIPEDWMNPSDLEKEKESRK